MILNNKFSQVLIEEYKGIIAKMSLVDLKSEYEALQKEWYYLQIRKTDNFQEECLSLLKKEIAKRSVEK